MEKVWTKTTCCNDITDCSSCPIMTKGICKHIKKNKPIYEQIERLKDNLIYDFYEIDRYIVGKKEI